MMLHGHNDGQPCGLNCPVGGADGAVRLHFDGRCDHAGINVCPQCAELTDEEVAALRKYFDLLAQKRASEVER